MQASYLVTLVGYPVAPRGGGHMLPWDPMSRCGHGKEKRGRGMIYLLASTTESLKDFVAFSVSLVFTSLALRLSLEVSM